MKRREFLGKMAGAFSLGMSGAAGSALAEARPKANNRPNIVVIMADDMGYSDIGCYGSEIATPNLDGLARDGLTFTHAYNTARCCPSRAALLTGLYPHQAGMGDMVNRVGRPREEGPYQGYLNRECVTIAEVLKQGGYRTYMSGKWHVGEAPEHWPRKRGFDRYFGLISGASSYWEILPEERDTRTMAQDDERYLPSGDRFYMTDAFTDHAVQFIDEHRSSDDPFFLYLAYTAPHWPLHAWPEDIEKYRDRYLTGWDALREERYKKQLALGIIDPKWRLSPRDEGVPSWDNATGKEEWALRMAVYAAMVDRMDQGIGRVMEALKKSGADDNTLVVFLSDNGGCHETTAGRKLHKEGAKAGERGSFVACERPWANASNTPFRMFKHWVHEGGIATPFIARWPKGIKASGKLSREVVHITDIMATCTEVSRGAYPETFGGNPIKPLVGRSLAPLFSGKTRKGHNRLFWEHERNCAVREDDWKLVMPQQGAWELYNLKEDRTELTNLVASNQEKAKRLHQAWLEWAAECGVKVTDEARQLTPTKV